MFASTAKFCATAWKRLTPAPRTQRLSWFAIILVFIIDAYVLTLLFDGTNRAGELVDRPYPAMTRHCIQVAAGFLQGDEDDATQTIEWFAERVQTNRNDAIQEFDIYSSGRLPVCDAIRDKLLATVGDPTLEELFRMRRQQLKEIQAKEDEIRALKATYSDALMEKAAQQERSNSILPVDAANIKSSLAEMGSAIATLKESRASAWNRIRAHPAIAAFAAYLKTLPVFDVYQNDQERFERAQFWYPYKVLATQVGFLIPLLSFAVLWNRRALDKRSETSVLISSHLILVAGIPIAVRLLQVAREFVWDVPVAWLRTSLDEWNLGFIWSYALVFVSIAVGMLLIFVAQRTLFTAVRQRIARLRKALCHHCGEKLLSGDQAWCEVCGAGQSAACSQCGQPRRLLAFYCGHCGTSQPDPQ